MIDIKYCLNPSASEKRARGKASVKLKRNLMNVLIINVDKNTYLFDLVSGSSSLLLLESSVHLQFIVFIALNDTRKSAAIYKNAQIHYKSLVFLLNIIF